MTRQLVVILLLLTGALVSPACKEQRSERIAASYRTVSKASGRPLPSREPLAVSGGSAKMAVGTDAVPVEEDYEARAASSITEANFAAKLAELERELRL